MVVWVHFKGSKIMAWSGPICHGSLTTSAFRSKGCGYAYHKVNMHAALLNGPIIMHVYIYIGSSDKICNRDKLPSVLFDFVQLDCRSVTTILTLTSDAIWYTSHHLLHILLLNSKDSSWYHSAGQIPRVL